MTFGDNPAVEQPFASLLIPPRHDLEEERLIAVREIEPVVWPGDEPMASLARQASEICHTPIALVSLMEEHEQRFLACVGRGYEPANRDDTFCAYAILQTEPMVVENALTDPRFQENPFVRGDQRIRFYLGAPILDGGLPLGTVCVADTQAHEVSSRCLLAIERLAERAAAVLRLRRFIAERHGPFAPPGRLRESIERLNGLLMPLVER